MAIAIEPESTIQAAEPAHEAARASRGWRAILPLGGSRRRGAPDQFLLVLTLILVGVGIVMIYSASAIRAQERFGDPTFFLKKISSITTIA